jgi:superfamily II DNA/RNA helicase
MYFCTMKNQSNIDTFLANYGISTVNHLQEEMLDASKIHDNIVLLSPTGSGKTLGFLLPLLCKLDINAKRTQALILAPSRELAIQIESVIKKLSTVFKVTCCYGGHSIKIEQNSLIEAPIIVVGTPGRIAHHLRKAYLKLADTEHLILDEFDKLLEFGFQKEMDEIIAYMHSIKSRTLTSATDVQEIPPFVEMPEHKRLSFLPSKDQQKLPTLTLKKVFVEGDKIESLLLLLGKLVNKTTIVFCNHREVVDRISEQLKYYELDHGVYHGGVEQLDRERTLIKLRNGSSPILVTTDLASRGLDIPEIEAVIHYQMPPTEEVMIHRNGRTARMSASGEAYFLLDTDDYIPEYVFPDPLLEKLPREFQQPEKSQWQTLYLSAGKKDKVNKMDIVGFLLQKGGLSKEELGKIEVLDHQAFAAIQRAKIKSVLQLVQNEKLKGKKVKMEIAR